MNMTALIAAAAAAAGQAPVGDDYPAWRGRVLAISADLAAMVNGYEAREARKAGEGFGENDKITPFFARLVSVKEITKGQGDRAVRKGQLTLEAPNSSNSDAEGHETIETAPLGTPEGDEEFMRAQALVGQNVKVYKRNFLHPTDKSKKLKELVAIDPASGFSAAPAVQAAPFIPPAPVASDLERLDDVRDQLNHLSDSDKNKFREFMQHGKDPMKAEQWTDDHLDVIERWLFSGAGIEPEA